MGKQDFLPRVVVNVREIRSTSNTPIIFTPAILLKTPNGPIGEAVPIKNSKEFQLFGISDETAVAYGVDQYLKDYDHVYITRVASADAEKGIVEVMLTDDSGVPIEDIITGEPISMFKVESEFATDMFNGSKISVVNDLVANVFFIKAEVGDEIYESIRVGFDFGTADAVVYQTQLKAAIDSINYQEFGLIFTQTFIDKTEDMTVPTGTDLIEGFIAGGSSGYGTVDDNVVQAAIHLYDTPEIQINAMTFPEFENLENIKYAVKVARENSFRILSTAVGDDVTAIQNIIGEYPQDSQLSIYLDSFVYLDNSKHLVPASIAVLTAYAKAYIVGPYSIPAGVNRAVLPAIKESRMKWSLSDLTALDNYIIPVNPVLYKTNIGYVVWDEKTTAPEKDNPYSAYVSGADLINYLVKQLNVIGQEFLFEPITYSTFKRWELDVTNLLSPLVANSVIVPDFEVVMDSTNNNAETVANNQLIGDVRIRKVGTTREIIITLDVSNQLEII